MAFLNSIYKALTGRDVEALLQKLSEREAEISKLQTQIESQAANIDSQAATIKSQKAILESQDSTIISHTATITAQSDKIAKLNKNLKETSENLESVKEQLDAELSSNKTLTLKVSDFKSKISKLEKYLEDEQTSKSAIEERFNDTQVELFKAKNQIEELSEKNNSNSNEIRRLTDLIEKASVERNSFKEKLETIQKSLSEAEQKTIQQTNLLQQEKEKYANAEQLLSKAESESKELNSELSAAKAQISELSTKLQQTQNEKEGALAENLSLHKQLQELSEKIALQESIINEKTTSDDVAEVNVYETTDEETEEENDEVEVEENVEEVPQEDETTEFEIDWDNVELEITDVDKDTILADSTLSITKVWDVRNKKEIDAKQFFSLPEGEIMSMRRELQLAITTDNPYWVCPVCGQMVKISGKRTARGKALFFSHLHDSEDCPIKTNTGLTKRMIEARKYALVQESERHHRLKTSIANFLEETNSKSKGVSDVQIEKRVTTDLPFMNWRCPDVQAMYNGMHLVFELQLSTTFISTIVERDLFYRLNNYFIIWVFNFEENKEYMDLTNLMCKDIYYANKRNIFVFDKDAQAESLKRKELVLKCNWLDADNTWHYGPTDGDGNGIFITIDQLKFDTKNNKPYYYDADKEYFLQNKDVLPLREKQELDLKAILEGLERREQQKKERKAQREAKKEIEKESIVVANDKTTNEESLQNTITSTPEENKPIRTINANGHEYVDLGLPSGTLWATCNVGATKPEEYGDYFAWGEVKPKDEYSWKNYKWCCGSYRKLTKYCTNAKYGIVDNKNILELEDDAARKRWGGGWYMPTYAEQHELCENCIWEWVTQNGVKGYKVTSKTNGNSIFMPAAGLNRHDGLKFAGFEGYYLSTSIFSQFLDCATILTFKSDVVHPDFNDRRYGLSVRPVLRVGFTLSFMPNGGQGKMPTVGKPFHQSFTLPTCTFKHVGYEFVGWNTQPDGTGINYPENAEITLCKNTEFYAQWRILYNENMHNGHEYVDLGLPSGVLWATCNVGATKPEEYGDYIAWGEARPKREYNRITYSLYANYLKSYIRYNRIDHETTLAICHDAAHNRWGGGWYMPTYAEQDELRANCIWVWDLQNGVVGCKLTSKINGNSIFLPAAGSHVGSRKETGSSGNYWSSSLRAGTSYSAFSLYFNSGGVYRDNSDRYIGHSVRPVLRVEFTLSFVPNGGQGEMPAVVKPFKQAFTLPTCTFKRDGYEFIGWNTQPDGTGEIYVVNEEIKLDKNITLYAIWKKLS